MDPVPTQPKTGRQSGRKTSRIFEIIVILFVVAGMVLTVAEIRHNINAEWARRQQVVQALDPHHFDPTPTSTPTLIPTQTPIQKSGSGG